MRVLIMGLPGAGKTTLSLSLIKELKRRKFTITYLNADEVRSAANDWDFTLEGRIRQAERMCKLADVAATDFVIGDFVAALEEQRLIFNPDFLIWMNTIEQGRYADTNAVFEEPESRDYLVKGLSADHYSAEIADILEHRKKCQSHF